MVAERIKLRQVQCLLEVARRGSLVQAADALGITQPAVSKSLRELEELIGHPLLERSRKGVFPTSYGEVFMHYAAASTVSLRQGIDAVAQLGARGGAVLRIGVLPTVAARLLPDAVERFKRDGVEPSVRLASGPNDFLLDRLRDGRLDLVVGRLASPEQMADLTFLHLYSETVRLVVRPGHPLADEPHPDLQRLTDYTVILPSEDAIIRPSVDRLLIRHGVGDLPDRIETVSSDFGRTFTRNSDAVWIISFGVVAPDLEDGSLAALNVDTSDTVGPVGLTTRADFEPTPAHQLFMNAVRAAASRLR